MWARPFFKNVRRVYCKVYLGIPHSSDPPKGRGIYFDYLPRRGGETEKLKKGRGSMVQGQVFLKGRAGTFPI